MSDLNRPAGVYDRRAEIQIVDVREENEWKAGRIAEALFIPLNELMGGAGSDLDRGKPVVLVCRSGERSELATMMMKARGFDAYNLLGGMEAWEHESLPFTTPDGGPGRVA